MVDHAKQIRAYQDLLRDTVSATIDTPEDISKVFTAALRSDIEYMKNLGMIFTRAEIEEKMKQQGRRWYLFRKNRRIAVARAILGLIDDG